MWGGATADSSPDDETVNPAAPPLPSLGASIVMERGRQQNGSPVNGQRTAVLGEHALGGGVGALRGESAHLTALRGDQGQIFGSQSIFRSPYLGGGVCHRQGGRSHLADLRRNKCRHRQAAPAALRCEPTIGMQHPPSRLERASLRASKVAPLGCCWLSRCPLLSPFQYLTVATLS